MEKSATNDLRPPIATLESGRLHTGQHVHGREDIQDTEYPLSGYLSELDRPAASGIWKITRSSSPIKEESYRTASTSYGESTIRHLLQPPRTVGYMNSSDQEAQDLPPSRSSPPRDHNGEPNYDEFPVSYQRVAELNTQDGPQDVKYQMWFPPRK